MNSQTIDTIRRALERYRNRMAEVEAMGWYNTPDPTQQEIARIDAALAELVELEQAGTWEPVEDGEYSAGKLLVHELAGRYVIATKATHDDTGQDYWNATSLPPDYRLCRRTTAQEQARPDAMTPPHTSG